MEIPFFIDKQSLYIWAARIENPQKAAFELLQEAIESHNNAQHNKASRYFEAAAAICKMRGGITGA